tara:strand:+ start:2236 stop:2997 length:762 start_codon:yes stop_codon:yes gene_type:complete
MIYEVHRKVKNNVGDYYCNPSRYFDMNCTSGELMYNDYPIENNNLIVGGGGLIHKKFSNHIQTLMAKDPATTTLWGIGHNFGKKHIAKTKGDVYYPEWIKDATLIGIRDWIEGYEKYYLPCVSCLHPAFDKEYESKREVVYFTHAFKSKFTNPETLPYMKNNEMDFDKVIEFLGSAKTIVTDSYHGAYWAQLLGKNVQVASWSVKFNHMKHQPHFINSINDKYTKKKNTVDGFLQECRELNNKFYQKFLTLLK